MANPQAEYTRRLLQSRLIRDQIIEKEAIQIRKLLRELDSEIEGLLKSGSLTSYTSWQRSGAQKALREILESYQGVLEKQITTGTTTAIDRTISARLEATRALLQSVGAGAETRLPIEGLIGGVTRDVVEATVARMYPDGLILSDRVWHIVNDARKAIDNIVAKGIIQGESAKSMSMKLRFYVRGAESVPAEFLADMRRTRAITEKRIKELMEAQGIGRDKAFRIAQAEVQQMRDLGHNIAYRSFSLARSEVNASYHEAHIIGAMRSPVVKGQKWNLSGRHPRFDECDIMASADYYGLGAGVYPIGKTPHRAHTNCLCYLTDVLRPVEEWEEPKPEPELRRDPMTARYRFDRGLTLSQKARYRGRAADLVNSGDRVSRARASALV